MKVLMTADAVGGVWSYATDLAAGLRAAGVEVVLAVLGPPPADRGSAHMRLVAGDLDWTAETPEAVLASGAAVADLAARERADLVHLNSPALAAGGAFRTPVLGVCHSDVATWWAAVKTGPLPPDLAWRADLTARGYAACDALLAPSRAFAEATAAVYGVPPPTVVLNSRAFPLDGGRWPREAGSDGGVLASDPEGGASHSPLESGGENTPIRPSGPPSPIEGEGRYIFTAGRLWDEGKGMATLDAAAARVDAGVLAAGALTGPNGAAFAPERLTAVGALSPDAMAAHHAAAAIFVSPALYEPFGLAVLEAAQAGRPLVLSDIPTFRELWDGAAVFVPVREPDALAAALSALLADAPARARLGEAARRRAERYTPAGTIAGVLAAYRRLLDRRAAA